MHPKEVTGPPFTLRQFSWALAAALLAFLSYTSVYAYRKPFTVATFEGVAYGGIPYQTLLIICQVIGYMASKFFGIRFIAELKRIGRWKTALLLIGISWLALLGFALVPPPWGMVFLFINGFPLGFLWGIVFSYVEGRRSTDFIGSVMAVSFVFAGGFTRSVAVWIREHWLVADQWLGFVTGLLFLLPLLLFIHLIEKIPPPDDDDIRERTIRLPMNRSDRRTFLRKFGTGIFLVTLTYLILTVMRDIRDNYMTNMWIELGYRNDYKIMADTETITSVAVLLLMAMLVLVRNNILAFRLVHWVIAAGFLLCAVSSFLFVQQKISGAIWMQLTGLGLYLGYIPFNCIFFERLIAVFRISGNVGFLIYFADAFGYLGSVSVMLGKALLKLDLNWSAFYSQGVVLLSVAGIAGVIGSYISFNRKYSLNNAA